MSTGKSSDAMPVDNIPEGCRMGRRGALPQIYDPADGVSLQLCKLTCSGEACSSGSGASSQPGTTAASSASSSADQSSEKDSNKS